MTPDILPREVMYYEPKKSDDNLKLEEKVDIKKESLNSNELRDI